MATCKENCIHYSVCGIWDRKVFVDYEKDILSDFSDLLNVEEYCRNYFPKPIEAEWERLAYMHTSDYVIKCSNCENSFERKSYQDAFPYCPSCGAKMIERR